MLPGPVFTFELITTARRGRFYVARALYGILLLLILWAIHSLWSGEYEGELPSNLVNWFAFSGFAAIAVGQELLVLVLTPALVAGVIADEKRRRTLHYVMASQLTSAEIVLGKLLVRMLYVGVLLGVSLPVMSLLVLLGGVDPRLVLLACGCTLSTAWLLAALSIWVSTFARRPREALFVAFGLEWLWLFFPTLVTYTLGTGTGWRAIDVPTLWLAESVGASSPVRVFGNEMWGVLVAGARSMDLDAYIRMIGLEVAAGAILAILAAVQLRPVFQRQDGATGTLVRLRVRPKGRRARRFGARVVPADRPMLWKELQSGRARGLPRLIARLLTVIVGGFLAYYAVRYFALAYVELFQYGYRVRREWVTYHANRLDFFTFLWAVIPLVYLIGIMTVAGSAAAAITSEHEEDTWVSLTTTDLTGREIIFAKLLGSLRRARWFALVIGVLTVLGIATDAVHPFSLPALGLALAVYGWFAAALGTWISLQLRSTWRAQFLTIASLLLVNVAGQGVLNMSSRRGFAPQIWPGFTPYEVSKLVLDPFFRVYLSESSWPDFRRLWDVDAGAGWMAAFSMISLAGYATLAAILTCDCLRRFEIVAGRARRPRRAHRREPVPVQNVAESSVQPAPAGSLA
jgi:ABC-type transport system involved in multi-copper enzyme maturation permease subunit